MNPLATRLLRLVIVLLFLGVALVQLVVLPELSAGVASSYPEAASLRVPTLAWSIAVLVPAQVVLVGIWRLLALVRRDAVFSPDAFRWVDLIVWASVGACVLALGLLSWLTVRTLDFGMQPGIGLALIGCAVLAGGIALLVVVLRGLLVKAVGWKGEAAALRIELDEVI
ncbi:DUF2975 domain-containing protein [Promicromonospora sp. MEB111]|uniref:DUF2975 domain-containing protein n=1 Tax=Promicromonospora sp. MEB111 TaxID=3040301 RepID=UPI00254E78F6|nr:DUF2975 domain-containing protein [Promicromonospora sp. MEB111]